MQETMPVERQKTAHVILTDTLDRVLLLLGGDPSRPEDGRWWFAVGGGVDPGETLEQAARREVREETGLELSDLGSVVFSQDIEFDFEGVHLHQREHYFVVRNEPFTVSDREWTDLERHTVTEYRWWPAAELAGARETVYPLGLAEFLAVRRDNALRAPDCVFCAIAMGMGTPPLFSDQHVVVVDPPLDERWAKVHRLIVPRRHIPSVDALGAEHQGLAWRMLDVAKSQARAAGIDVDHEGYQLITNAGRHGVRKFPHLHWHLVNGRG